LYSSQSRSTFEPMSSLATSLSDSCLSFVT